MIVFFISSADTIKAVAQPASNGNRGKFPGGGWSHSLESVIQALNDTAAA